MTTEIFAQLQAIEDSIPEGGLVNTNQLKKIHELLSESSFMYLQPTSLKEICYDIEKRIYLVDRSTSLIKMKQSINNLKIAGYI